MNAFEFVLPTRIKFGHGVVAEVGEEIKSMGKKNVLLITGPKIIKTSIVPKVMESLEASGIKDVTVFTDIEQNPRDYNVHRALEVARQCKADIIVAVGGGSVIDVAKAVGIMLTNPGEKIQEFEGLGQVKNRILPIVAIPTTVGTGSEVTFWSVITDTDRHFKMSIGSPLIAPELAVVDPDLVESLPASVVASTGMDALTHAIEGYTCLLSEPITDACGIYAVEMIAENLRKAALGNDPEARAKMLLGSLIAGICFGNSDIAAVHAMAEAVGGLYDTPHGVANAILLPYVMEYNCVADIEKFSKIAQALGENTQFLSKRDAAYRAVEAVHKLNADLGMPSLQEVGVDYDDLDLLADKSAMNVSVDSNPRKITKLDFLKVFRQAYAAEKNVQ
jgi:alcohol dehydrogenase